MFEFDFLGVFYEVLGTATFWFYWPLASVIALAPTIIFRTLRLDLSPTLVDDVRLKMKKEGQKLFRRIMFTKALPRITLAQVKERTGYAFSHQGGFGKLILSGRMFGGHTEEQVQKEREKRISTIIRSAPSSPVPPHKGVDVDPTVAHLTIHTLQAKTVHEPTPPAPPEPAAATVDPTESVGFVIEQKHESLPDSADQHSDSVKMDQLPVSEEPTTNAM